MTRELVGVIGGEPFHIELGPGQNRVGRPAHGIQVEIPLSHASISRMHAEFVAEGEELRLRDLGSRNGTWVNGRRVEEEVSLFDGDRIRFGVVELILRDPNHPGPASRTGDAGRPVRSSLSEDSRLNASRVLSWEEVRRSMDTGTRFERILMEVMTETGNLMVVPRPLEELLDTLLSLVERIVPARRLLLLLDEGNGTEAGSEIGPQLQVRAARPAGTSSEAILLSQTLLQTVLRERTTLMVTDVQSDDRFRDQQSIVALNLRSALISPLFDNEKVIGLIYADSDDPRMRYDEDQMRAFTLLANLIAVKITNTRLLRDQREKERMEQEMATAASIQRALLPEHLPETSGYEILARQTPCFEVGGDLYDAASLEDGSLAFVLGDVSGKGMGAALLMSSVLASLRLLYEDGAPPETMIQRLHRQVWRSTDARNFVTVFLGRLDPRTHCLHFVNAGHNPPLLLNRDGTVRELAATGMPVGLMPQAIFEAGSLEFPPGALLCIFSDGIPEALAGEEFFGEERLTDGLRRRIDQPLDEIASGVLEDLQTFLGTAPAGDDITILLLRRST